MNYSDVKPNPRYIATRNHDGTPKVVRCVHVIMQYIALSSNSL